MAIPLYLVWQDESGKNIYRGYDLNAWEWLAKELQHGVLTPAESSLPVTVVLRNPGQERKLEAMLEGAAADALPESFTNVRLYLRFADQTERETVMKLWPAQGCGVRLSLDAGSTWILFDESRGYDLDPSTWIPLPGPIGPYPPADRVSLQLKVSAPVAATETGLYTFSLEADLDVL